MESFSLVESALILFHLLSSKTLHQNVTMFCIRHVYVRHSFNSYVICAWSLDLLRGVLTRIGSDSPVETYLLLASIEQ